MNRLWVVLIFLGLISSSSAFLGGESSFNELLEKVISRPSVQELLKRVDFYNNPRFSQPFKAGPDDKFFRFLPNYQAAAMLTKQPVSWKAQCYLSNTASVTSVSDKEIVINITASEKSSSDCVDFYLIATVQGEKFFTVDKDSHTVNWRLDNITQAEKWDITTNGFRIFSFLTDEEQFLADILYTSELFIPAYLGPGVPMKTQELNLEFLGPYANLTMPERTTKVVKLNASQINSGDFFGVIRLDGLDPMLAWGMGSHTGHTTIALWFGDELYICESTVNSPYWPTNGIQRTPYEQWLQQAEAADYNVVHLPLSPANVKLFNATAAANWFYTVEGLPYGYNNMLLSWIDTPVNNYPCIPPNFTTCLPPEFIEPLAAFVDRLDPSLADLMFNLALNRRIGITNESDVLRVPDVAYVAATKQNLTWANLLDMPEQDSWIYPTGYQMVCDVFVCEMWKNAGLFGDLKDQIQCTEFTNWDAYSLAFFDADYIRPQQCVDADPSSQFCQLLGDFQMSLPGYNTKAPYANMAQKCPSRNPAYYRPSNC